MTHPLTADSEPWRAKRAHQDVSGVIKGTNVNAATTNVYKPACNAAEHNDYCKV